MSNQIRTLYPEGSFFKGNLHCHSTFSDGRLMPEQLKDAYKRKGYQFILFSDHNLHTHFANLCDPDFLVLRGFEGEMRVSSATPHKAFHLLFLKKPDELLTAPFNSYGHLEKIPVPDYTGVDSLKAYVARQEARGYMTIFNHPYWSFNDEQDIACLDSIIGMEVFNYGCQISENTGCAELMYDLLLRKGKRLWGFASDDNHNLFPFDSPANDSFGGYLMVKAHELTEEGVAKAIWDGSFYASQGPEINDFYVEDGRVYLTCSPAERVYISDEARHYQLGFQDGGSISAFCGVVPPSAHYLRAEVIDCFGRKAYANPIFLK
jgi:hypothetical protein